MAGICSSVQIEQARQSMKTVLSPEGGISGQIAKDCNVVKGYPPASSFDAMFPQWETSAPAVITLLVFGILALVTIVFVLAVAVWVTWLLDAIFLILVSFDNAENAPVEATDLPIRHQISNRQLKANSLLPKIKSRPQELSDRYLITLLTSNWI
ncbi:hypothetical protein BHE90_012681 [Fusarium euwallaceae]|uniref:Uncharacterized protein n=2 Tax=Fusarium solani species complex TaxID=232080 RepID=A0A428UAR6_9HYPO|nr:hypothetical protein CEP52_003032 [Fusarium oligoseptatum]RTE72897.1 hypothetical protein BHE90_012681 [Fusarium euwallaceae]